MNTSLSWIKMYVPDLDVTAQEYTDAMTLTGTKVEGFEKLDADLDKIVIGQIDKIEKHPDADKLIICQVNIGTESVQIVTGAPNVKEGDKVSKGGEIYSKDLIYWIGYIYRYFVITYELTSMQVYKIVKPKELKGLFLPYHTMDPSQAIERILEAKGLFTDEKMELERQYEIFKRIRNKKI